MDYIGRATMISRETAQAMVLRRSEGDPLSERYEKFAVQSCELSTRGDYWIVRVNSEAYVLHGQVERCYVGANAHLVDVASGQIETVCSGQSVGSYLQQKYDIESAAGMHYTLQPTFGRSDKAAIIRFRQTFACSLQSALRLAMPEHRSWLTGSRHLIALYYVSSQVSQRKGSCWLNTGLRRGICG